MMPWLLLAAVWSDYALVWRGCMSARLQTG